ncbi:MAG: hypothetical protein PHW04_16805 [Candidatus Wallbacteria bacterium]|nr:hypothetical protein [Candidatus Wallbacteria bacterium]
MKRITVIISLLFFLMFSLEAFYRFPAVAKSRENNGKTYAIAVNKVFFNPSDPANDKWQNVLQKLIEKHSAEVFIYEGKPDTCTELKENLKNLHPYYVCFLSKPNDCERDFAESVIRCMAGLENAPYDGAVWAIFTAYNADDALKMVDAQPLELKETLSHAGSGWLDFFDCGTSFSEGVQYDKWVKESGKQTAKVKGPADTTDEWVKCVNSNQVDLLSTSGHASEKNWMMGYSYSSGTVAVKGNGMLQGTASDGKIYDISTDNPKVYYSPGNCLIAHITASQECMVLSWMHNGCYQFFGHLETQNRTCTAWGIAVYFFYLQDTYTYAEAVHANRIASRYLNQKYQTGSEQSGYNRCLGITMLYGDPAWEVKMKRTMDPLYVPSYTVTELGEGKMQITATVLFNKPFKQNLTSCKPPVILLPWSISGSTVEQSNAKETIVGSNFIMLDLDSMEIQAGQKVTATVSCSSAE